MKMNICGNGCKSEYKEGILHVGQGEATRGGGIFCANQNNVNISGEMFMFNHVSKDGAGIFLYNCQSVCIENCIFVFNFAKWGGAIYLEQCSEIKLSHNKFILNYARRDGGAISLSHCSNINITNDNIFWGNIALRSCRNIEFHHCQ